MNLKIEIRYGLLIGLLVLLWLIIEFLLGFQDRFIAYHPFVSLLVLMVPVICLPMAVNEKIELRSGAITFRQAFISGLIISLFSGVLMVPVQFFFHEVVNPDFFQDMVNYSVVRATYLGKDVTIARAEAESYFNFSMYLVQSVLFAFVTGSVVSLIVAWKMKTIK